MYKLLMVPLAMLAKQHISLIQCGTISLVPRFQSDVKATIQFYEIHMFEWEYIFQWSQNPKYCHFLKFDSQIPSASPTSPFPNIPLQPFLFHEGPNFIELMFLQVQI